SEQEAQSDSTCAALRGDAGDLSRRLAHGRPYPPVSTLLAGSRSGKLEDEERASLRARGDHLLADRPEEGGNRERTTGNHRDILLAAQLVRHGRSAHARDSLELTQSAARHG